eukprot:393300-Pyramimonas_sp.AAC.1
MDVGVVGWLAYSRGCVLSDGHSHPLNPPRRSLAVCDKQINRSINSTRAVCDKQINRSINSTRAVCDKQINRSINSTRA